MTQISVIIPIYNTAKYLHRCLDSVINQSFKDIEIICINDGSTDNSEEILYNYAKLDSRIVIIDLDQNQGVSNARNLAIENSKSPYLFFLDSDDYIELEALELLINTIKQNNADVVFGATNSYIDDKLDANNIVAIQEFANNIKNINLYYLMAPIGGKMVSKAFIEHFDINFDSNLVTAEDFLFNFKCVCKNAKIIPLPVTTYNYFFLRDNSATYNLINNNTELLAVKHFINTSYYKEATLFHKISSISTCVHFALFWHKTYFGKKNKAYVREICEFLKKNISHDVLKQCPNYSMLEAISKTNLQNFFSITSWIKLTKRTLSKFI